MMGKDLTIKTYQELHNTRKEIQKALLLQCGKKEKIPIVYKYPGAGSDTEEPDSKDIIGAISNIRVTEKGDIVGTCEIYPMLKKSQHFTGTLDNLVVGMMSLNPKNSGKEDGLIPTLISGIVYDKFAKSVIDDSKLSRESSTHGMIHKDKSPVEGNIPYDKAVNPLIDPKIKESIDDAMKSMLEQGGDN